MGRRLSVLLRGPAVLAVVLAVLAIVTVGRRSATALPSRDGRPTLAPATVRSQISFALRGIGMTSLLDPITHTLVAVRAMQVQPVPSGAAHAATSVAALLEIMVDNLSTRTIHFSGNDFFLLADSGDTYAALTPYWPYQPLATGSLHAGATVSGWRRFDLPPRASTFTLYWTDDNYLLPPEVLARIALEQVRD